MSIDVSTIRSEIAPVLKLAGVLDESDLNVKVDACLEKRLMALAEEYNLKFIILYGSYATGKEHKDSDLDVAVICGQELKFDRYLSVCGKMQDALALPPEVDLDFKTLSKVDPLFRYEVTRDGKLLYGDAADYKNYKVFSLNAYHDTRPLFNLERKLVHKFQEHLKKLYD